MYAILAFLSAIGLRVDPIFERAALFWKAKKKSQKLFPFVKMTENHGGVLKYFKIRSNENSLLEYHDLGPFRYIFYCILSYVVTRQRFFIPGYLCIYKVCYEMKKSP